jgi:hypothetical protein
MVQVVSAEEVASWRHTGGYEGREAGGEEEG